MASSKTASALALAPSNVMIARSPPITRKPRADLAIPAPDDATALDACALEFAPPLRAAPQDAGSTPHKDPIPSQRRRRDSRLSTPPPLC